MKRIELSFLPVLRPFDQRAIQNQVFSQISAELGYRLTLTCQFNISHHTQGLVFISIKRALEEQVLDLKELS